MKSMELLETIGSIRDKYLLEAEAVRQGSGKSKRKPAKQTLLRNMAAVLALILACALFFQTPVGAAAAEMVRERVTKLIETLFPPKNIVIAPEGQPIEVPHEAQGREPEENTPGFAIYVDTEHYTMTEEDGAYYIRPVPITISREEVRRDNPGILEGLSPEEQEAAVDRRLEELERFYAALPACELVIREIPDKAPMTAAEEIRQQILGSYAYVSDIWSSQQPKRLSIDYSSGTEWDAACGGHYFYDNGKQGTFHIAVNYYLEATEGYGTRLYAMLDTFAIVAPQDASQYTEGDDVLLKAMEQEVAFAQDRNEQLLKELEDNELSQADMNGNAQARYELWLEVHHKLWDALEQAYGVEALQGLLEKQLEWSAWKADAMKEAEESVGGGSLAPTVVYGNGAELVEQRVYALLNCLRGTAPIPQGEAFLEPEPIVQAFADAYFAGNTQIIKALLSDSFQGKTDIYREGPPSAVVIHEVRGLDAVVEDMARYGCLNASVAFRVSADSDYYTYLSIAMVWEQGKWRVTSYGLEG